MKEDGKPNFAIIIADSIKVKKEVVDVLLEQANSRHLGLYLTQPVVLDVSRARSVDVVVDYRLLVLIESGDEIFEINAVYPTKQK